MRVAACCFSLLVATNVAAAEPGDAARADALFKEARALMKAGSFETACPKLEESYRLDPAVGAVANLGDCFEGLGKIGSALLAYQAARKLLTDGDPRIGPVERQIAALQKRVPKLTITLAPEAAEGTVVTRDGKAVDFLELGKPLDVNPGTVIIVVAAPGRERVRTRLSLAEGEARHFVAEVGGRVEAQAKPDRAPDARTRAALRDPTPDGSRQTLGYLVGGAGLVATAVAIGTYVYVDGKAEDHQNNVPGAKEDGERIAPVFYAATGLAIVGLGLGGYLLLSSGEETRTAISVRASGTTASAVLTGRF